ncbi:hypothetical protein PVT68_01585 [Microbulbifer bruguierae]|uniref:Uncharacterized protein n=1 Tax=Microbulbifer bruguierae TaxID=3029061 RepID=A0ABY8NE91_9GAMM|nr:hypothetical protein [Microbulbifer bruguierae]WGL17005.1 hypothetical protein PVT68_01585 [Microbulbifer bruguierae]
MKRELLFDYWVVNHLSDVEVPTAMPVVTTIFSQGYEGSEPVSEAKARTEISLAGAEEYAPVLFQQLSTFVIDRDCRLKITLGKFAGILIFVGENRSIVRESFSTGSRVDGNVRNRQSSYHQ